MGDALRRVAERFTLEDVIGTGGTGRVYRARDLHSGETVAVKVVEGPRPEAAERFLREAVLLAALDHPAIVRYVDHGALAGAGGDLYLAMEWLDGQDLA